MLRVGRLVAQQMYTHDLVEVPERHSLELRVGRSASRRGDRHLVAKFARIDCRLRDAPLRGQAHKHNTLAFELLEQQRESRVIEGGVARLQDDALAPLRREAAKQISAASC